MHISEGVLAAPVLAAGAVLTVAGVAVGLKKTDTNACLRWLFCRLFSLSLL